MGVYYEIREKISSPFFRPDESLDRQKGGAGLGLAIVKKCRLASRRLLCHWW
jgi:two-component system OmpR family sensor kinase